MLGLVWLRPKRGDILVNPGPGSTSDQEEVDVDIAPRPGLANSVPVPKRQGSRVQEQVCSEHAFCGLMFAILWLLQCFFAVNHGTLQSGTIGGVEEAAV